MGLCCCTMVGCPLGICAGSISACCIECPICEGSNNAPSVVDERKKIRLTMGIGIFGTLLMVGIGLYALLTEICSQADNEAWMFYKSYGECWGTHTMAGAGYHVGLLAGLLMGIGTPGLLYSVWTFSIYQNPSSPNDDDDDESVV